MMKMQLSLINRVFLLHYRLPNIVEINCGWCMQWAYVVYCLYGGTLCSVGDRHHAFIKIDGKYYDSECVQGTEDWRDLPCIVQINFGYVEDEESQHFIDRWYFTPNKKILENIKELINNNSQLRPKWLDRDLA